MMLAAMKTYFPPLHARPSKIVPMARLEVMRLLWHAMNQKVCVMFAPSIPLVTWSQLGLYQGVMQQFQMPVTLVLGTNGGENALRLLAELEVVDAVVPHLGTVTGREAFLEAAQPDLFADQSDHPLTDKEKEILKEHGLKLVSSMLWVKGRVDIQLEEVD
jgi:hypothetical protein